VRIPLPTIEFATDKELKPILPTLSLANSARFGTLFGFAFTRPAKPIGRFFDSLVRPSGARGSKPAATGEQAAAGEPKKPKDRSDVDANWKVDGSYLGSRGGLLDLGLEIGAKDAYWIDLYLGLALDTGEDKGFIRVPEEERDTVRWLRSQGFFGRQERLELSYSHQSDAGVRSGSREPVPALRALRDLPLQWRRSPTKISSRGRPSCASTTSARTSRSCPR
jgi:hypothetical protein